MIIEYLSRRRNKPIRQHARDDVVAYECGATRITRSDHGFSGTQACIHWTAQEPKGIDVGQTTWSIESVKVEYKIHELGRV